MYRRTHKHSLPGPDDTFRKTLPNGITLLVRENFASPAIVARGYVEAGAEDEAPRKHELAPRKHELASQKHGLAGFVTDVMERGTQARGFDCLYEEVESIGANFGLSAGTHITSFGVKGLAEYLPLLMDIISDVIRNPAFRNAQVEKARAEILTSIQERENDTRRMANLLFHELIYPDTHPYHWSLLGYPTTIPHIQPQELVEFHEGYFSPQGMVIVIVGAVKADEAVKAIEDSFGNWQRSRPERADLPDVPPLTERRDKRVCIEDKTQSNLVLGWPGPSRTHPDFIPCHVANTILGIFGMYGRLGQSVRQQNGLAYYAYSKLNGGKGPGAWRVVAGVNPSNEHQAITLIQQEIRRIQDEAVSEEELNDSKSFLTGSLPLQLETNEGVAHALINIERYNLGLDYLQNYNQMIQAITAQDIQRVAQQWLDAEKFALAVGEPKREN